MKAAPKRAPKKQRAPEPAPLGLRVLMSAVRFDSDAAIVPAVFGAIAHCHAQGIVSTLHTDDFTEGHVSDEVKAAFKEMFTGLAVREAPECLAQAGFYVGLATAWLLMRDGGAKP